MGNIEGTIPVSGTLAPFNEADVYPVFEDTYNKGGHRCVPTLLERDNITTERRKEGMLVYVSADHITYQLITGSWEIFAGSSGAGDKNYTHIQGSASTIWNISHNLGKYPSVTVIDSALNEVEGDIEYIDYNTIRITFSAIFSGTASFN